MLPFVDRAYCAFEECVGRFRVVACRPTSLLGTTADSGRAVTSVAAGDTLRVWQIDLVVRTTDVVRLSRDTVLHRVWRWNGDGIGKDSLRLARGDTLFVFPPLGGEARWTYQGVDYRTMEFWPSTKKASNPAADDWWYVQPVRGATGWWHAGEGRRELHPIDDIISEFTDCADAYGSDAAPRRP